MRQLRLSRPWLTAGIISGGVTIVGIGLLNLSDQSTSSRPNPLGGHLVIGLLAILVGFPAFAVSLIGGAIGLWRRQGPLRKLLASFMIVLAIPLLVYSLLL